MSQQIGDLKPYISVLMIIGALFTIVFCKMEVRRLGYSAYKEYRELKLVKDDYRLAAMKYAKITSPRMLRKMARHRLTLSEPKIGQVIQITGNKIAFRQ